MNKEKQKPLINVVQQPGIASELDVEVVSIRNINLTIKRAYEFLEMDTFAGERQVNERWVQTLYNEWNGGRFRWEQVAIGVCLLGDKQYRVNGQHTCWLRTNLPENTDCPVRELTYRVKTEADLRALYNTFCGGKPRSAGHSVKAIVTGTRMVADLMPCTISTLFSGLKYWLYGEGSNQARSLSPADLAALATERHNELFTKVGLLYKEVYEFVPIRRRPVVAAMFITMDAAPNKCAEFWGPVSTGLGFTDKNDGRHRLRLFLQTHGLERGAYDSVVSAEDMYRICVQAWNRWRKNEPCTMLRPTEKRVKAI